MKGFESSFVPGLWVRLVGDPLLFPCLPPPRPPSLSAAAGSPSDWLLFDSSCRARIERDKFLFCFPCVGEARARGGPGVRVAAAAFRLQGMQGRWCRHCARGGKGTPVLIFGLASTSAISFPDTGFYPHANDLFHNIRRILFAQSVPRSLSIHKSRLWACSSCCFATLACCKAENGRALAGLPAWPSGEVRV